MGQGGQSKPFQDFLTAAYTQILNASRIVAAERLRSYELGGGGGAANQRMSIEEAEAKVDAMTLEWARTKAGVLEPLFLFYDKNKDGTLGRDELTTLMYDVLVCQKHLFPEIIANALHDNAAQIHTIARMCDMSDAEFDDRLKSVTKHAQEESEALFTQLVARHEELATGLFAQLDRNKDGMISKQEFLEHYTVGMRRLLAVDVAPPS